MRIVGGQLGGRVLRPPQNSPARPTTERAREGLFNMLEHRMALENSRALELFAGTGAVSFELLSRTGEAMVTAVEQHGPLAVFMRDTANTLGVAGRLRVVRGDALKFISAGNGGEQYDLVFADPPYALREMALLPGLVLERGLLAEGGWLVLEHGRQHRFEKLARFVEERAYGEAVFSFFR